MFFFFFDDDNIPQDESLFDSIKHINEYGEEYWSARELIPLLEYNEYRFFKKVIDKAINACEATDNKASDHFVQVHEMVTIGSGAGREKVTTPPPATPRPLPQPATSWICCLQMNRNF